MRQIFRQLLLLSLITVCFGWPVHAQSREAKISVLLKRLDRAPLRWEAWDGRARRGDEMAQTAASVASLTKPLAPRLERVSKSRSLAALGRVPVVGSAAQKAQKMLGLVTSIDKGFVAIVEADERHNAPLRAAAQAGARLQRSRLARDAPAVMRSFDAASVVLSGDETRARAQRTKLMALKGALAVALPLAERDKTPDSRRVPALKQAQQRLANAIAALDRRADQLGHAARWLREGAAEAKAVGAEA